MKQLILIVALLGVLPITLMSQSPFRIIDMPIQLRRYTPRDTTKNYIVIHNDGANMSAVRTRNVLQRRRLAYHYFVDRQGKVYQYVHPRFVAPHAGISFAEGLLSWNNFSIGICLQGISGVMYSDAQYTSLQLLLGQLSRQYRLYPRLYAHSDVAFPWGRKKDPGPTFDTTRIRLDTL